MTKKVSKIEDKIFDEKSTKKILNFFSPGTLVSYTPNLHTFFRFVFFDIETNIDSYEFGRFNKKFNSLDKNNRKSYVFLTVSAEKQGVQAQRFIVTFLYKKKIVRCYLYESPFGFFKRLPV